MEMRKVFAFFDSKQLLGKEQEIKAKISHDNR